MTHPLNRQYPKSNVRLIETELPNLTTLEVKMAVRSLESGYDNLLEDLKERLEKADQVLKVMIKGNSMTTHSETRTRHLESKAEGVRLALSYLEEYL